ncbi:MAG: hypothetical protein KA792_06760, partial [Bacteroidales bacterium]|nr:hypothetical protein [Bacteroidales bacterium]
AEINDILRAEEYEKAIGDINKELIKKQTTKKYSFTPITDKKGNNFILIKAKNLSKSKFNVILSYGKDEDKSGGFVVTTLDNDEVNDYIIRVNTQESWFKIDNNWISLEPLGGDIEVYSIQIVQGK